jgi:hypothetical protein
MRTTVDIADEVYADLKTEAVRQHTSVRALIDQAARLLLAEQKRRTSQSAERRSWPVLLSGSEQVIGPFDNDFALFSDPESFEP